MTSSYNLTRRDNILNPTNFEAFQKQFGVCPPGYITIPISPNGNCSDWKICQPLMNSEGLPSTFPEYNTYENDCKKEFVPDNQTKNFNKCSHSEYNKNCKNCAYRTTSHFSNNLYYGKDKQFNNMIPQQSLHNFYPPNKRVQDNRYLHKEDYFRLPNKFNGTGYDSYTRSWEYPVEYATDQIRLPDEWIPFHLIQRKDIQKQTLRELQDRIDRGFKPYERPYPGNFYKDI